MRAACLRGLAVLTVLRSYDRSTMTSSDYVGYGITNVYIGTESRPSSILATMTSFTFLGEALSELGARRYFMMMTSAVPV